MSAVAGSALLVYHGESERRSRTSAGSWPAVVYQVTATAWLAIWNGTVRSTAAAVRLTDTKLGAFGARGSIRRRFVPSAIRRSAGQIRGSASGSCLGHQAASRGMMVTAQPGVELLQLADQVVLPGLG